MVIIVDIDGTICTLDKLGQYENVKPIYENIDKINKLYNDGHKIIYWTARGTQTKIDWQKITYNQLCKWGCKFDDLRMKKPYYDLFIDDKCKRIEEI